MAIGITNLAKAAAAIGALSTDVDKIMENGIGADDLVKVPALFADITMFFGIEYNQLKTEVDDLDAGEAADLAQQFKAAFDLRDDNTEALIEKGLEIILAVVKQVCSTQ
jgi:hypothetical protein